MAITGILLFGRLRGAERSFCRDAEDGANSVTGRTQDTNARVLLVIVVGSFIGCLKLSRAILLLCQTVFGSPLPPSPSHRPSSRRPKASRGRCDGEGGRGRTSLLSSPSGGVSASCLTIHRPMPHPNGQTSHTGHHGNLLVLRIARHNPFVGHFFFLVGADSGPGRLAKDLANT